VKLCVCHNKLFQSMIVRAKHRIEEGRIGDLTGVDLRDSWAGDNAELLARDHWCHKLPPGPFGEMLPHPVYIHAVVFQVFGLSDRLADDMDLVPPIRECGREAMVDSGDSATGGIRRVLPAEQRDLHSPASSPR
jgi:predicted dehydrogenase